MSYITAQRIKEKVLVWERGDDGVRQCIDYKAPWYFYTESDSGDYTNIYGDKLIKHVFDSRKEFLNAKNAHVKYRHRNGTIIGGNTYEDIQADDRRSRDFDEDDSRSKNYRKISTEYESDIIPELKILSDKYYRKKAPKLHITGYDIEVDYDPTVGFPRPVMEFNPEDYQGDFERVMDTPYAPINSISIYNFWENKNYLIAIPPDGLDADDIDVDKFMEEIQEIEPLDLPTTLEFVNTERELLLRYLDIIDDSDMVFGWNSDTFDNPYVAQRIEIVLGTSFYNRLSFREARNPVYKSVEMFGEDRPTIETFGRVSTDYLDIYKKFTFEEQPSYKLESIAELELPKMRKLEYSGSLYELYRENFQKFVRYNIRDTEILYGFEDKLGFIQLANEMYHDVTGLFKHVFGTLKSTECALINYCHHEAGDIKVEDNKQKPPSEDEDGNKIAEETIDGAYVLEPRVGQHDKLASVDITSLYPKTIESNNISPETIIGQLPGKKEDYFRIKNKSSEVVVLEFDDHFLDLKGKRLEFAAHEWPKVFLENNWSISAYGTIFNLKTKGILPSLLSDWFVSRKELKGKAFQYYKDSEVETDPVKKAELLELSTYYDRLQLVKKIQLNSAYGALCNKYFKFYDLRLGSSTTATGQELLKHQTAETNRLLTGEYDMRGDSIIYGDTDSTYFKTYAPDIETATKVGDAVGKKVNQSFPKFMRESFFCTEDYDKFIETDREIIGSSGIFIAKKLYIIHIVDNEGKKCDKIKAMGVSLKKSTLPKEYQVKLTEYIERLLKGDSWDNIARDIVDYKQELSEIDNIMRIGLPIGVKNIEKYTNDYLFEIKNAKDYRDGNTYKIKHENKIDPLTKHYKPGFERHNIEGELCSDGNYLSNGKTINLEPWTARLPGHVAASIHWNKMLVEHEDHESIQITSGTKIKVYYLKRRFFDKFKSIAIPTDTTQIPEWFISDYKDFVDVDAQLERLIDNSLKGIFGAIGKEVPTAQGLLIDDLLSF